MQGEIDRTAIANTGGTANESAAERPPIDEAHPGNATKEEAHPPPPSSADGQPTDASSGGPATDAIPADVAASPAAPADEPGDGRMRVYLPPPISGPPLVPGVPPVDPTPTAPASGGVPEAPANSDGSAVDDPAPVGSASTAGDALASGGAVAFVPQAVPPVEVPPVEVPPGRRRAWLVGVPTLFAAAVVAVGVFFATTTIFDAIDRTGAVPAAARSSAPPLLTPEAYQQMLAAADAALAVPFQQFAAATGPTALDSTATTLASAIDAEADRLSAVRPPEAATAAHQLLVGGLGRLQWEPAGVDIEGRADGASCTGAAGAASVARTTPAGQVREAAGQLKAVDPRYVFGSFLPAVSELQSRRMDNGAYLKRTSTNGSGQLKVNNDGPKDTAVSLVLAGETAPRLTVYVQGNSSFTARGITDGNYLVYTTAGVDWDPNTRVFSRDCEFTKFKDGLEFKTNSGTYTVWTISLSPSESGNAPVEDVDADTYPTG